MSIIKKIKSFFNKIQFKRNGAINQNLFKKEYKISNFLNYESYFDDKTIMLKNNSLMRVIKISGFSFETADDEDLDIRKEMRNQFFRGLTQKFKIYSHIVRYKKKISNSSVFDTITGIEFVDYVNLTFKNKFNLEQNYINELYLTITLDINPGTLKFLEKLTILFSPKKLKNKKKKEKEDLKDLINEFDEIINRVLVSFRDYSPEILSLYASDLDDSSDNSSIKSLKNMEKKENKNAIFSKQLEFLSLIANGISLPRQINTDEIRKNVFVNRLIFKKKHIEILKENETKYAGIISLKEYGQTTNAGFLDSFLQLPVEMVITQTFEASNRQVAINKMQLQQNRMIQAGDKAISQVVDITRALDDAMSGKIGFGFHHLTIMCIENSIKSLENAMSMAEVELMNTGVYIVREKTNMEPAYWAQFPGNNDYIVRRAIINSRNFAGMSSFHNYPSGKELGNHWGKALTVLNTTSKTPFYFNFHVRDIGHTMIVGPTGAGKTVLMNFLCCQAMKYKPKMFFFDKDRGAEIFLRAIGAKYTILESRRSSGFNPLQLDDNNDNRIFLMEWFKQMLTSVDKDLNSQDISKISLAIDGNFKLKKQDRILRNIVPFLGMNSPGSLASRMQMWISGGSHASLFDNEIDNLTFNEASVFGFEMAELLKDPIALPITLNYLFHRINISLDGKATMIVLDEAWALLDNEIFKAKIKDWLKVLRKLNAMVIFATQSVEDIGKSDISDTLVQQTATQIFLPNLKATSIYKSLFMLSQREFSLIKTTDPSSRYFLIKQNTDAIIAKLDLSGMGNAISILSGRAETVRLLDKIRSEVGDEPNKWLKIFYEQVNNINNTL
jgi:type IV secretion system protein VirB4